MLTIIYRVKSNIDETLFFIVKSVNGGPLSTFSGLTYANAFANNEDKKYLCSILTCIEYDLLLEEINEVTDKLFEDVVSSPHDMQVPGVDEVIFFAELGDFDVFFATDKYGEKLKCVSDNYGFLSAEIILMNARINKEPADNEIPGM